MIMQRTINCLLCGCDNLAIEDVLSGTQIQALWRSMEIDLSPQACGSVTTESAVHLYRCASCGFRFHDPSLAGSAEFYEELMSTRSYPGVTPEFAFALDFANRNGLKRVLDIGGGEGHFLDLARNSGMETAGVELNRNASKTAADKGHRMFNKRMEEITPEELDGGTDMLTLFQVVEHVPSPVSFVVDAARLVRPGGYMVIAVPSERRMLGLLHYDPANWPPHHISRWRAKDLYRLGQRTDLSLIQQGSDPLQGRSIPWAFRHHNQLATALGVRCLPCGKWFTKALAVAYRLLGCKHYLPCHGLSIYAVFRKSPESLISRGTSAVR